MKEDFSKFIFHCLIPIIVGIIIYVEFRGFYLLKPHHNYETFFSLIKTSYWVKYNLPDGLWFYALLSTLSIVWKENSSIYFISWIILSVLLTVLSEVSQAFQLIKGTFDWFDLLTYTIAFFAYYSVNFKQINKQLSLTFKK